MVRIKLYYPSHISPTKQEVLRWNTRKSSSKLTYEKLLTKIRSCSSSRRQQYYISWFDGKDYCSINNDESLRDALKTLKDKYGFHRHLPIYITYDSRLASTIYGEIPQMPAKSDSESSDDEDSEHIDYNVEIIKRSQQTKDESSDSSDDDDNDDDNSNQPHVKGQKTTEQTPTPVMLPMCVPACIPIPVSVQPITPTVPMPQTKEPSEEHIRLITDAVRYMGIQASDKKIREAIKQSDGTIQQVIAKLKA